MLVTGNINKIEELINNACIRAGRRREEISLMAVSKFVSRAAVDEAVKAGIRLLGESRVQEATEKLSDFRESNPGVQVHLIGSLQRNKAKAAAAFFDCVQSLDREELIPELAKHAAARQHPLDVLLELRTGEDTKSGFTDTDALCRAAEAILALREGTTQSEGSLRIRGLMTMAPFCDDQARIRRAFASLRGARDELEKRFPSGTNCSWDCLSMGMSGDFEIAIEEGSTLVRIGTAIFGGRQ